MKNEIESFDCALGWKLRTIRQMNRMSQEHLGNLLGVTFQQIQKYETGANRMSPERIYQCSKVFKVPVGYFFGREDEENNMGFSKRIMTIATAMASLPSDDVCKKMYQLALAITESSQDAPSAEEAA